MSFIHRVVLKVTAFVTFGFRVLSKALLLGCYVAYMGRPTRKVFLQQNSKGYVFTHSFFAVCDIYQKPALCSRTVFVNSRPQFKLKVFLYRTNNFDHYLRMGASLGMSLLLWELKGKCIFCFSGDCTNCSTKHGKCIKGFCECDDGWEGATCEQQGQLNNA